MTKPLPWRRTTFAQRTIQRADYRGLKEGTDAAREAQRAKWREQYRRLVATPEGREKRRATVRRVQARQRERQRQMAAADPEFARWLQAKRRDEYLHRQKRRKAAGPKPETMEHFIADAMRLRATQLEDLPCD